jgi:hypothetical protein
MKLPATASCSAVSKENRYSARRKSVDLVVSVLSNRVSATEIRILKIGARRLGCKIEPWRPKILKIRLPRRSNASLTRGNVVRIPVSGKKPKRLHWLADSAGFELLNVKSEFGL